MKKIFLFLLGLGPICNLFSQGLFSKTFGSPGTFNAAKSLVKTNDSGFAILGSTGGWGAENGDFALIKTDSLGNQQWSKTIGTVQTEEGVSMKLLPDGGFILAGNTSTSSGDYNIYVVRTNSVGDTVWTKQLGGEGWDLCGEIIALSTGGFCVSGTSYGPSHELGAMSIYGLNSTGNVLWNSFLENEGEQKASSILEINPGNIFMAGSAINPATGSEDMAITKWASNGNLLWAKFYGTGQEDWISSMCKGPGASYGIGGNTLMPEGNHQPYMFSIDADGIVMLDGYNPGTSDAELKSIRFNSTANSYLVLMDFSSYSVPQTSNAYMFSPTFEFQCSALFSSLYGKCYGGELIQGYNGYIAYTGYSDAYSPGLTSIFLATAGNGCQYSSTVLLSINDEKESEGNIYPNPTQGTFNVRLDSKIENPEFILTDISGKRITIHILKNNGDYSITISDHKPGHYFLSILNDKGQRVFFKPVISEANQ